MAEPVRVVEGIYDRLSLLKEVAASTDLATFFGEDITNEDYSALIISDGNLHYSVDGTAADADNAKIPTVFPVNGKQIKTIQLFSAAAQDVSIILSAKNT
jgi:hypothetical protein